MVKAIPKLPLTQREFLYDLGHKYKNIIVCMVIILSRNAEHM
jgi:hypothetical protein